MIFGEKVFRALCETGANEVDDETDILEHYGIKGMHWGVRRYQNPDGSLTSQGKTHRKDINKKLAIAVGSAAAGTAIVGGLYLATKDQRAIASINDSYKNTIKCENEAVSAVDNGVKLAKDPNAKPESLRKAGQKIIDTANKSISADKQLNNDIWKLSFNKQERYLSDDILSMPHRYTDEYLPFMHLSRFCDACQEHHSDIAKEFESQRINFENRHKNRSEEMR